MKRNKAVLIFVLLILLSGCKITDKFIKKPVDVSQIDVICITHEHKDHIQGLKVLAKKFKIPVVANSSTAKGIYQSLNVKPNFKIFTTGEPFTIEDLEFTPFRIPHDTLDPVGFIIKVNGLKLGFCTDLGFASHEVIDNLNGCDYLYLEANHQISMVHACNRSSYYKKRVLGREGHLSNEECLNLIKKVLSSRLKHIHLAHMSQECNSQELVLTMIKKTLQGLKVEVSLTHQDKLSKAILF